MSRLLGVIMAVMAACRPLPAPASPSPSLALTPLPLPSASPSPTLLPASLSPLPSPTPAITPSAATITRGPYLQSVTTDSIIVVWETDIATHGQVDYGVPGAPGSTATDPADGTHHAVTLTGLQPYTDYRYRVLDRGWPLDDEHDFRTAAGPQQTRFSFVVFGDTRSGHEVHRTIVDRIVALSPNFVLHTGDLVANGELSSDWDRFFQIEAPLVAQTSLFPSPGNHEQNSPLYFELFHLPGNERWYSFDYGNAHIVSLEVDGYAHFGATSEQHAWLEADLAANTRPWVIVYLHIPPYSSLKEDDSVLAVRNSLTPLFQQYGVDVVFAGHHHEYQRRVVGGITYIVTGGGGAEIYSITRPDAALQAYANAHHFISLAMDGDTLTGRVISEDGQLLDQFALHPR